MKQPWVEKYRPKTVNDVTHQEEVINTLRTALESSNMPHLMFYGPPGTGKTTTALAIGRELFGPELFKARVLELNASDERGINVVREKIKSFAATAVGAPASGYPCPPFKLLILDEADSMTADAQNALRRTMESYSKVTRFCFICNYVSRIIEPLASRCAKFRFKPIHEDTMTGRIEYIAAAEGVRLGEGVTRTLSQVSGGDLRKAITTLQSAVRLRGSHVVPEAVVEVSGAILDKDMDALWAACRSGRFEAVQRAVSDMIYAGYPTQQVLLQFMSVVLSTEHLRDVQRGTICRQLAKADKALVDGADEHLQLLNTCAIVAKVCIGKPVEV